MALHRSTGNSTFDSCSRCDPNQYSSLYDVRKRSDIKLEPIAATRPIHKDTIEISRDKLKEEALNRLRHTSKYVIAQNSFMRIGKYLFLAVAFPPYFIIYGLPKWICIEGLPTLFSFSLWLGKKIQDQMEKHIQSGTRKVIQMAQFVQRVMQVMMQPFVHLALQIRQKFRHFQNHSLRLMKKATKRVAQTVHFPRLTLTFAQRVNDMRYFFSKADQKWCKKKEEISLYVQQTGEWIKNSPQLILSWGQFQFQRMIRHTLSLVHPWKNRFEISQKWAQKGSEWISNQVDRCIEMINSPFAFVYRYYKRFLQPNLKKTRGVCKRQWQKIDNFLQRQHQRAFAFLLVQQEKLKRLSSERFLSFLSIHPWMNQLHSVLQNGVKKCLFHPITRKVCESVFKCYSFFVNLLLYAGKIGLHALSFMKSAFIKCWNGLRAIIQSVSNSIKTFLIIALRLFQKGALYALYYFLLFLTMSIILLIWAFQSLGEYTSYVFSTLSLTLGTKSDIWGEAKAPADE